MFKYQSIQKQLIEERKKRESLYAEVIRNHSDMDYIAMMTEVELEAEGGTKDEQI